MAGDTVLDGHTQTLAELAAIGKPVEVLTTYGRQMAEAPFKKGRALLYEIITESGKRIEVTDDHRFWGADGWIKTKDIQIGDIIAVSLAAPLFVRTLLASNLVCGLSKLLSNVRHWTRKVLNYQGDCSDCHHQYDQQLRPFLASDQACYASQYDELEHIHSSQPSYFSRALQWLGSDTHKRQPFQPVEGYSQNGLGLNPLSNKDDSPSPRSGGLFLNHGDEQISVLSRCLYRICRPFHWLLNRMRLTQLSYRNNQSESSLFVYPYASYDDIPNVDGYRMEKVSAITATAIKDYYTLHVPATEQYFANGILHHNSGKTLLLLRMLIIRALKSPGSRHAIFRFRFNAIKASIIYDTLPKVMKLCWPGLWEQSNLNKSDWFLTLPNGSEIWFCGLDDKDRTEKILGLEFATLYFNECSQIPWASRVLAMSRLAQQTKELKLKAYYDLNPSAMTHWVYRMFVEKMDPDTKQPLLRPGNYGYYKINPIDNKENLAPEYIQGLEELPERARKRFLYGEFADASEGALWPDELLIQNRVLGQEGTLPDWLRIVVAIDPSGCSGPEDFRSDEIGITVCALGTDGHGYLLEDLSGRYSPEDWAIVASEAYERHSADRIIGEKNFGGDMVRAVIQAKNPELPYTEVNASRGKVIRAEPISALYEQKKIHHVGYFSELEDQLGFFTQSGYQGLTSPDRADSMIWGFTALFPGITKRADKVWTPPTVHRQERSASGYQTRKQKRRY